MAHHKLEQDPAREQRIRERAYHLWEQDGRPHGRDREFWERARALVAIEDNAGAGELPNPATAPQSPGKSGVEEAEIQQNLGEFPGRFTDQGEVRPTPAATRSKRKPKQPADASTTGTKPKAPASPRRRKT